MEDTDISTYEKPKQKSHAIDNALREQILEYSKDFKTSWVNLGQTLFAVWRDKIYAAWGFEKFEHYTEKEVGLPKQMALKLLKTYYFLEQEEPAYLKKEFSESRDALRVPGYEAINVLRMAKQKKELFREDYATLKKAIFDKGKEAGVVRKDLAAIMKERKQVDPDEEREKRNETAIRKFVGSLKSFKKDMQALKLLPEDIVSEADSLMEKLETRLAR